MTRVRGMLTMEDLSRLVRSGEIETVAVMFTDHTPSQLAGEDGAGAL